MALVLTDENFVVSAKETDKLVVIDFWATWCGPCVQLSPIVEELSQDFGERALIGKVDVDSNPKIAREYGIRSLPTILFIKNGKIVDKHIGLTTKAVLQGKIESHL